MRTFLLSACYRKIFMFLFFWHHTIGCSLICFSNLAKLCQQFVHVSFNDYDHFYYYYDNDDDNNDYETKLFCFFLFLNLFVHERNVTMKKGKYALLKI